MTYRACFALRLRRVGLYLLRKPQHLELRDAFNARALLAAIFCGNDVRLVRL